MQCAQWKMKILTWNCRDRGLDQKLFLLPDHRIDAIGRQRYQNLKMRIMAFQVQNPPHDDPVMETRNIDSFCAVIIIALQWCLCLQL